MKKTPATEIEAERKELEHRGFTWRESRLCKICSVWIEIHIAPDGSHVALEIMPDREWKLADHKRFCRGPRHNPNMPATPAPAPQGGLF